MARRMQRYISIVSSLFVVKLITSGMAT